MTAADAIAGVEESLAALRRSHVDVLLAHDIQHLGEGADAVEKILQRGGMVDGLRQLQREGRVRFIGVSGRLAEVAAAVANRRNLMPLSVLTALTFWIGVQKKHCCRRRKLITSA